jgi:O-acetylhomoserine/O-acetylserine sulfhydrylase-like pyridoxal-dependent enzyme
MPMLTRRSSAVFLPRLGIDTKFVNGDNAEDFAKAIDEKTKAVYIERYALFR